MLKQPITFTDFNGETREIDIYFNLTEAELIDWQFDSEEGLQAEMQTAIIEKNQRKLLDFVKTLIRKAYGERDKDGIHFNKSEELSNRFENSAMYSPLLLALFGDEGETTANFINGLMPADLVKKAMEQANIPTPDRDAASNGYKPSAREQFAEVKHNVAQPIGARREASAAQPTPEAQSVSEQTGFTPALPEPRIESSHSLQDAAPVQVSPANPSEFQVEETPLDKAEATPTDPDFVDYLRRKAAGQL